MMSNEDGSESSTAEISEAIEEHFDVEPLASILPMGQHDLAVFLLLQLKQQNIKNTAEHHIGEQYHHPDY